jgi:hypothetical protein
LNLLDRSADVFLLIRLGVIAEFAAKGNGATIPRMYQLAVRTLASRNLVEAGCLQVL